MDMQAALNQLCAAPGPSGFEQPVAAIAQELLRPLVDEVYTDCLGSVIGVKRCGKPNAKRLVLDAHLDESQASVGFKVERCTARRQKG